MTVDTLKLAEKVLSLSPDEILAKIVECKIQRESDAIVNVLILAYKEVCEMRLEAVLERFQISMEVKRKQL